MENKVILTNWAPSEPVIMSSDLGWHKTDYLDAGSHDPQDVFNFFLHHFNSIVFFYPVDGNFYEFFMEGHPFKFWRVINKSKWNGKWVVEKISWDTHKQGEVLMTFDDDTDLWNSLKVNGTPIGDVIAQSIIVEITI